MCTTCLRAATIDNKSNRQRKLKARGERDASVTQVPFGFMFNESSGRASTSSSSGEMPATTVCVMYVLHITRISRESPYMHRIWVECSQLRGAVEYTVAHHNACHGTDYSANEVEIARDALPTEQT